MHRLTWCNYVYLPLFLTLAFYVEIIQAKEIYIQPSINIETKYDDNIRLRTDRFGGTDKSAYGVIARANAKMGVRSDSYDLALNNRVVINRYSSESDLDSEDFYVDFTSNFSATEKTSLSLAANYTRETALTSELEENDSGTGLIEDNPIREEWSVSPSWTYFLSNTQFLQANYTHSDISYEESTVSTFDDYTNDFFVLSYSQQWLPVLRNFYNVSVMYFDVPNINRETLEYSIDVGVEYQISPTWFASLTAGGRYTDTEITLDQPSFINGSTEKVKITDDQQGMIFSFSMDKQFETANAGINYSRSTSPQGDGRLALLDRFQANFNHRFTQRLHFSLTGSVSLRSNSGSKDEGNDRTNYNIRPTISWLFDKNVRLTGGYQYRRQEFERNDRTANSNSVFLNINYQWDKLATRRY